MNDFPDVNPPGNRKSTQVTAIINRLRANQVSIAPATYKWQGDRVRADRQLRDGFIEKTVDADGLIEVSWRGKQAAFVVEIKSTNTPRALEAAIAQVKKVASHKQPPLVIVPYLSDEALSTLEANGVSGFDLCGNMSIQGGGLFMWRGGRPNLYPDTRPIKNIYRGRGSVLARCFLLKSTFGSLAELREFALRRLEPRCLFSTNPIDPEDDSRLSQSTASKVVSALIEDLIVQRSPAGVELTDPRALIYKLRTNFNRIAEQPVVGKTSLSPYELWDRLRSAVENGEISAASTGIGSAAHYGAIATDSRISIRVSDKPRAMELLEVTPTKVFPNIEIFVDEEETALFDCRLEKRVIWASPIQSLLELATSGPRERDAAEKFETTLLERGMNLL